MSSMWSGSRGFSSRKMIEMENKKIGELQAFSWFVIFMITFICLILGSMYWFKVLFGV